MSIFRRKPSTTLEPPTSALLCQARSCANYNAVECGYRDRRGRNCRAAFCPEHSEQVEGVRYCRRHAGTMRALGSKGRVRSGLPDIDNRGPSLVNHIAAELDEAVMVVLASVARTDERVLREEEVTMAFDPERRARWERSWKLVEPTGVVMKVTVSVEDHHDETVAVRVGSELVGDGVPPWIQHRIRGESVSAEVDQSERRLFYRFLTENITAAVHKLRERDDHPSWS